MTPPLRLVPPRASWREAVRLAVAAYREARRVDVAVTASRSADGRREPWPPMPLPIPPPLKPPPGPRARDLELDGHGRR